MIKKGTPVWMHSGTGTKHRVTFLKKRIEQVPYFTVRTSFGKEIEVAAWRFVNQNLLPKKYREKEGT